MTDEENKRQRHIAEMMLAQCDGKVVQCMRFNDISGGAMEDEPIAMMYWDNLDECEVRIKPELREWWICLACNLRIMEILKSPHFPRASNTSCCGEIVHVVEVLND